MLKKTKEKSDNRFFEVEDAEILSAQEVMGIIIPDELKNFYSEIGYGFIGTKGANINRIMGPGSISNFRLRKEEFEYDSEIEYYDAFERDKLVFFEVCEGYFLLIGISKENSGKIYDGDKEIAKSLDEFIERYQENEKYFL